MPIYDLGYRHWEGEVLSRARRWWILSRRGVSMLLSDKKFLVLLILSGIPFLVRGVMIYVYYFSEGLNMRVPFLQIDGKFYFDFLRMQAFPIFLMMLYAGSGLIANDLRYNALQIYFSKPITRLDYILGKLGIVGFFTLAVTLLPGLLLFFLHMAFANDLAALGENLWLAGSIILFSLILASVNSLIVLALSSLSRSSRFVGLGFFAIFFFSEALFGIVRAITRDTRAALISLQSNFWRVGEGLFDLPSRLNVAPWESSLVLLALLVASVAVLFWRIKPVEVVR